MAASPAQLRQPKLAELVANMLRQRIMDGQLEDGQLLPNQDSFVAEFGVSRPSMREALRILEAEGLITVQRGNTGGAIVHRPQARHVATTLAVVLEANGVTLSDVGAALQQLEGTSAGLCARRKDRATSVVPVLRDANKRAREAVDDSLEYVKATSDFHRGLIELSGNETIRLLVGSLESTWLTHVRKWAETTTESGSFPDRDYRLQGIDAHDKITDLIKAGDVARATAMAESHFDPEQFYLSPADANRTIDSSAVRAGDAVTDGLLFGV